MPGLAPDRAADLAHGPGRVRDPDARRGVVMTDAWKLEDGTRRGTDAPGAGFSAGRLAAVGPERIAEYERHERRRLLQQVGALAALVVLVLIAGQVAELDPVLMISKIGNFGNYIDRLATLDSGARVWTDPVEWFWGAGRWLRLLFDTVLIAWLGTLIGAVFAFVLSFLASENLVENRWIRFGVRRGMELLRTVPEMVFALLFVASFGLGPLPGVLALAVHTTGALGKLFAEVVENIDRKPVDGLVSTGAGFAQTVRFAVVPQVLAGYASYALLRFEVNVRAAAVIGLVGAGGIGQNLMEAVRKFYYSDVSAILVMIIAAVMLIDTLTERLRHALIGEEAAR